MRTRFLSRRDRFQARLLLSVSLWAALAMLPLEARGQGLLDIMRQDSLCNAGDLAACEREGDEKSDSYETSTYDAPRALKVYQRACKGGRLGACASLGKMHHAGKGTPKDFRRAAELFQKACTGGMMPACTWLGGYYQLGTGVKPDPKKARALWQKACAGKDWQGCLSLASAHELGIGGPVDLGAAVSAWESACLLDEHDRSCERAGMHYLDGKGVEKDLDKAKKYTWLACKQSGRVCVTACKLQPEEGNCPDFLKMMK